MRIIVVVLSLIVFVIFAPIQYVSAQEADSDFGEQATVFVQDKDVVVEELQAEVAELKEQIAALEERVVLLEKNAVAFDSRQNATDIFLAPIQNSGVSPENLARFRVPLLNGLREAGIAVFEKSGTGDARPNSGYELRIRLSFVVTDNQKGTVQGTLDLVSMQTSETILSFEMSKGTGGDLGSIFGGSDKSDLGEPLEKIAKAMIETITKKIGASEQQLHDRSGGFMRLSFESPFCLTSRTFLIHLK